jgi:hypothetical protein
MVGFDVKDYGNIDHGYAATVHKSQGSSAIEFWPRSAGQFWPTPRPSTYGSPIGSGGLLWTGKPKWICLSISVGSMSLVSALSDPMYGGNRDMAGWKLVGFPGAYDSYAQEIERWGLDWRRPPVPISGSAGRSGAVSGGTRFSPLRPSESPSGGSLTAAWYFPCRR